MLLTLSYLFSVDIVFSISTWDVAKYPSNVNGAMAAAPKQQKITANLRQSPKDVVSFADSFTKMNEKPVNPLHDGFDFGALLPSIRAKV
jgi:hypothetical protein